MTKNDVLYLDSHEWIHVEGSNAKVGISSYAAMHLGDIVFFDLPEVGDTFKKGQQFASVESVKSASNLYLPVSGRVLKVNDALLDKPELVNEDPFNNWIVEIEVSDKDEIKSLLSVDQYEDTLE